MYAAFQLAPGRIYQADKPVLNNQRCIKRFPCLVSGATSDTDPCTPARNGLEARKCDMARLSGCRKCHREFDANPQAFAALTRTDIPDQIQYFNYLWDLRQRRPA